MPIIRDFNKDLVPMDNPIEARKNDLIRITEWLASPAGLKFAGKQALLRTTGNLDSFSREDIFKAAGRGTADAATAIAMILAQVPLNGTGTHFLFNELSSLAFSQDSFYIGNRNAANEANYRGIVTIKKSSKIKGAKTWDDRGFAPTGDSDDIGVTTVGEGATKERISKDTLPVVFYIVGEKASFIIFRGFVTGLTNSFNANWNAVNYVGRGEAMYTYANSTRGISFKLQVPMFSKQEQEACYKKVNSLTSHIYPKYENNLPQGTLTGLRIGDYFNQYCVINSITDTVDINVPWSVGSANLMLPQVINLQINAQVVHRNLPTRYLGISENNVLPYIGTKVANTAENE